jgi:thiol:disulfide interchange protein DsbA
MAPTSERKPSHPTPPAAQAPARRAALGGLAACGLLAAAWPLSAQPQQGGGVPQEGRDYLRLDKPQPVDDPSKPEVIEFFWYSCPHCFEFEPMLNAWSKRQGDKVVLKRVPVAFRDSMVPQIRLYYALESLGKLEELHQAVFNAIHRQRQPLDTLEQQAGWIAQFGVGKEQYAQHYNGFSTQSKTQRARQMADAYRIDAVPTLAVNGRYTTTASLPGIRTSDRLLPVVDYLIGLKR